MRIVSKFHDYYDGVGSLAHDDRLVYVRATQVFNDFNAVPAALAPLTRAAVPLVPGAFDYPAQLVATTTVVLNPGLVLFAGRLYPVVRARLGASDAGPFREDIFLYGFDELEALVARTGLPQKHHWRWQPAAMRRRMASLRHFFGHNGSGQFMAMALEAAAPSLVLWGRMDGLVRHAGSFVANPCLKDLQFFRALDAWQAWQELEMFLGNLAAPERVPVGVAERDRIAQRGFDAWSFKKRPKSV